MYIKQNMTNAIKMKINILTWLKIKLHPMIQACQENINWT